MAYLLPAKYEDESNVDYTVDYWMLNTGPFGVSGFCQDGTEVGSYCHLCQVETANSQNRSHFETKRHCQKVKALRANKAKFVVEPSTGGEMDDPDNLFLSNHCKVCDAELSTPDQQSAHYMSEKHQKKVRNYFLIKVGIREKRPDAEDEDVLKKKSKMEYCSLCKIEFSAPVVAKDHYAGKKHAKRLREMEARSLAANENENNESTKKRKEDRPIEPTLQAEDTKRPCLTQKLLNIENTGDMQE